jgi:hypothetical protein
LRNATSTAAANFVEWAATEAEDSPGFRASIDALRVRAAGSARSGYPRTTGPLSDQPWSILEHWLAESRDLDQHERPLAWKNTDSPTADGLSHVHDYLRACRTLSRRYLGPEDTAPLVHQLVGASGYRINAPTAGYPPAPTGGAASTMAAQITGASWTGATALRQSWRRGRPDHRTDTPPSNEPPIFRFARKPQDLI